MNTEHEISQLKIESEEYSHQTKTKSKKRKYILAGIGLLIFLCIILRAMGVLRFNAGGISIRDVVVTDKLDSDGRLAERESITPFEPLGRIYTAVYTSGIDATIGMRWYHEDELLFEFFERTQNNYIATFLEGSPSAPLPGGNYHVEIYLASKTEPIETVEFTVKEFELELIPPYPTPVGHRDLENSPYLEVPFAFDEIWEINGQEWEISETKIVFLSDAELFVVVVKINFDFSDFSESALEGLCRPIAQYAIQNGYWEQARDIQINGETYELDEPIAITLINPDTPNQGYRARFALEELKSSD